MQNKACKVTGQRNRLKDRVRRLIVDYEGTDLFPGELAEQIVSLVWPIGNAYKPDHYVD